MGIPRITLTKTSLGLVSVTAITLLAGFQLMVSPFAAAVDTKPVVHYTIKGSCGSGQHCRESVYATSNPSNYHYRAWVYCASGIFEYGGWHNGTGTSSNTASCPSGHYAHTAGFQYDETHKYDAQCWASYPPGFPLQGSC